jgi:uncharacterized protein DUF5985
MLDGLLVGVVLTSSLVASTFFLKFWRMTRDWLFLAFAFSFAIEGCTRVLALVGSWPRDAAPLIYVARLISYLLIILAIAHKNRKPH